YQGRGRRAVARRPQAHMSPAGGPSHDPRSRRAIYRRLYRAGRRSAGTQRRRSGGVPGVGAAVRYT
ncbi:hypothetical protein LTR82_018404, partial [Friedmanniomyces endolithicus]